MSATVAWSVPSGAMPVDLDDVNSARSLAVLSVPPCSTVLDVGSGTGAVARALAARGCHVWGIDIDADATRLTKPWCDRLPARRCRNGGSRRLSRSPSGRCDPVARRAGISPRSSCGHSSALTVARASRENHPFGDARRARRGATAAAGRSIPAELTRAVWTTPFFISSTAPPFMICSGTPVCA